MQSQSRGFPSPSIICPSNLSEHLTLNGLCCGITLHPGEIPISSSRGISITNSSLNPTTSQFIVVFFSLYIIQSSPTNALIPCTSIVSPITFLTTPSLYIVEILLTFLITLLKSKSNSNIHNYSFTIDNIQLPIV